MYNNFMYIFSNVWIYTLEVFMFNKKEWKRQWIKKQIENGRCLDCGRPNRGKRKCPDCLLKAKLLRDERRGKVCLRCLKDKPEPGKTMCRKCLDYYLGNYRSVRDKRKAAGGLCSECWQPATNGDLCDHHFKNRGSQIKKNEKIRHARRQEGLCEK